MGETLGSESPILLVDDDVGLLTSIKTLIVKSGLPVPAVESDSRQVMDVINKGSFKLVLIDLVMPHLGGMELLQQIKEAFPAIECLMITAVDDVEKAVQAMQFGAYDYLLKPVERERLILTIIRALEKHSLRQEVELLKDRPSFSGLAHIDAFSGIVAEDEAMAMVFHQVETVAPTDYSVVLTGESGTGKELIAGIIHRLSRRSLGPFVPANMAAFSLNLFDAEFFGHEKGAYTGAEGKRTGFIEQAQGGTLFLDEITELDLPLQAKLLRVIQERELYRLGSTRARDVDVRIVATSNRNIKEEIVKGTFREDLYYRLNMYHIHIPALRERTKDIVPIAGHFLKIHAKKNQRQIESIAPDLAERLQLYGWPGNVRELESVIAGAVLMEKGKVLSVDSVPTLQNCTAADAVPDDSATLFSLKEMEQRYIYKVLNIAGNNKTRAAKILEINLRTLQRKLKADNTQ